MERERKRRQLKTQGGQEKTTFFQSTKLALMNSGLIPLKKGELSPVLDSNSRHHLLLPVQYGTMAHICILILAQSLIIPKSIIFLPHWRLIMDKKKLKFVGAEDGQDVTWPGPGNCWDTVGWRVTSVFYCVYFLQLPQTFNFYTTHMNEATGNVQCI